MAKSQIIKDLTSRTVDISTALKRAKLLFFELDNKELLEWVNCEINGYPDNSTLPSYRVFKGNLFGSYFKGSIATNIKYTHVSLPLGDMPDDQRDALLRVSICDGVDSINKLIEELTKTKNSAIVKPIPADCFPLINHYNHDPFMIIASAQVEIGVNNIASIISVVENRLLDALLVLEKEFGNLDELDIDISSKSSSEIEKIVNQINCIIFNDNSITIGNDNRIKDLDVNTSG